MKVLEPGHVYELTQMDDVPGFHEQVLVFLNRECDNPEHDKAACGEPHAGVQSQEVLRALIDRAVHVETCLHHEANAHVVHHLRMALTWLEARAVLRKVEKGLVSPEELGTGKDGHWRQVYA